MSFCIVSNSLSQREDTMFVLLMRFKQRSSPIQANANDQNDLPLPKHKSGCRETYWLWLPVALQWYHSPLLGLLDIADFCKDGSHLGQTVQRAQNVSVRKTGSWILLEIGVTWLITKPWRLLRILAPSHYVTVLTNPWRLISISRDLPPI